MFEIIMFTGIAFVFGVLLVSIDHYCNKLSKKQNKILSLLPGYNCGNCGFGSCEGMSEAMLKDLENYKKCHPLKGEALKKMQEYVEGRK